MEQSLAYLEINNEYYDWSTYFCMEKFTELTKRIIHNSLRTVTSI
jgi:hypothetical protein